MSAETALPLGDMAENGDPPETAPSDMEGIVVSAPAVAAPVSPKYVPMRLAVCVHVRVIDARFVRCASHL